MKKNVPAAPVVSNRVSVTDPLVPASSELAVQAPLGGTSPTRPVNVAAATVNVPGPVALIDSPTLVLAFAPATVRVKFGPFATRDAVTQVAANAPLSMVAVSVPCVAGVQFCPESPDPNELDGEVDPHAASTSNATAPENPIRHVEDTIQ